MRINADWAVSYSMLRKPALIRIFKRYRLVDRHFIDAFLVTSSFKSSVEEFGHNFVRHLVVNETSRHYQNVGIIMLACQVGNLRNPAKCGTYALMFVQSHADAFSAATDCNTRITFARFYGKCQRVCKVCVVATVGSIFPNLLLRAIALHIVSMQSRHGRKPILSVSY